MGQKGVAFAFFPIFVQTKLAAYQIRGKMLSGYQIRESSLLIPRNFTPIYRFLSYRPDHFGGLETENGVPMVDTCKRSTTLVVADVGNQVVPGWRIRSWRRGGAKMALAITTLTTLMIRCAKLAHLYEIYTNGCTRSVKKVPGRHFVRVMW